MRIREYRLDIIRFVAIFLVTGFHIWRIINKPSNLYYIFDLWQPFNVGWMGCALFIALSGYLCMVSWKHINEKSPDHPILAFYKNKAIRILPAYYLALFFWYILVVKYHIAPKPYAMTDILTHLTFTHVLWDVTFYTTSGVFWYIGVQAHFYVLFPFLNRLMERVKPLCLYMISFIPLLILIFCRPGYTNPLYRGVPALIAAFMTGIMYYKYETVFNKSYITVVTGILSALILFVPMVTPILGHPAGDLEGIFLFIFLMNFDKALEKITYPFMDLIVSVAEASYSIYLYNYIFEIYRIKLFGKIGLIIYILLTLGFGLMMFYLFEKPMINILKRLR